MIDLEKDRARTLVLDKIKHIRQLYSQEVSIEGFLEIVLHQINERVQKDIEKLTEGVGIETLNYIAEVLTEMTSSKKAITNARKASKESKGVH